MEAGDRPLLIPKLMEKMDDDNEQVLPSQGGRIPRDRRSEDTVPVLTASSSHDGLSRVLRASTLEEGAIAQGASSGGTPVVVVDVDLTSESDRGSLSEARGFRTLTPVLRRCDQDGLGGGPIRTSYRRAAREGRSPLNRGNSPQRSGAEGAEEVDDADTMSLSSRASSLASRGSRGRSRGRGRPPTSGEYVAWAEAQRIAREEERKNREWEGEKELSDSLPKPSDLRRDELMREEIVRMTGCAFPDVAAEALAQSAIVDKLGAKCKKIKGNFGRYFRDASARMEAAVHVMARQRGQGDLEAENENLRREVADLRVQVGVLRGRVELFSSVGAGPSYQGTTGGAPPMSAATMEVAEEMGGRDRTPSPVQTRAGKRRLISVSPPPPLAQRSPGGSPGHAREDGRGIVALEARLMASMEAMFRRLCRDVAPSGGSSGGAGARGGPSGSARAPVPPLRGPVPPAPAGFLPAGEGGPGTGGRARKKKKKKKKPARENTAAEGGERPRPPARLPSGEGGGGLGSRARPDRPPFLPPMGAARPDLPRNDAGGPRWADVIGRRERRKLRPAAPVPPPRPPTGKSGKGGGAKGVGAGGRGAASGGRGSKRLPRPPRQAAVVLHADGGDLGEVLRKARSQISLRELGVDSVRVKKTLTGALLMEVPGPDSSSKADELAARLRSVVGEGGAEGVRVSRPKKLVELRVRGLDDSVTTGEVAEAVAAVGGCTASEISPGEIRRGPDGLGTL